MFSLPFKLICLCVPLPGDNVESSGGSSIEGARAPPLLKF